MSQRLELGENLDMAAKPDLVRQSARPKCRLLDPGSLSSSSNVIRFGGGSEGERLLKAQEIDTKYLAGYQTLFRRLIELGKPFAAKHNIKVDWQNRLF